ncbi:MAG: gliding motility-associated C-terminal domain-containing protein [Saprospiraceae bacterium]
MKPSVFTLILAIRVLQGFAQMPADCQETWIKTAGHPALREGGCNLIPSEDGNLYGCGFRENGTLLFKMTPDGMILWSYTVKLTSGMDERVTGFMEDSDGMLVGVGIFETPISTGFFFRFDPETKQILWVGQYPGQSISYLYTIVEKSLGGNFLSVCSYNDSPPPGSFDDANLIEIDRSTGKLTGINTAFSFGSSESILRAQIRHNKLYTAGRNTYGISYSQMRCALSCFDLQGNPQWARMTMYPDGYNARIYATDFCFDDSDMVTISYGDFNGSNPASSQFAVCKTDSLGKMHWTRLYTVAGNPKIISKNIIHVPDGYVLLVNTTAESTSTATYLIKTDKTGAIQWAKKFPDAISLRGEKGLVILDDYIYLISGYQQDILLAKVDHADGLVSTDCPLVEDAQISVTDIPTFSEPITYIQYPGISTTQNRQVSGSNSNLPVNSWCEMPCLGELCDNGIDDDGDGLVDCDDNDCLCEPLPCDKLYAPNVFTPNNDGINDYFYALASECMPTLKTFRIFSRWGELIFERNNFPTNQPDMGWDGRYKERDCASDVYIYLFEFENTKGEIEQLIGDVTLLR